MTSSVRDISRWIYHQGKTGLGGKQGGNLRVPLKTVLASSYAASDRIECPRKPNLLSVGLICLSVFFGFSSGKTRQFGFLRKYVLLLFVSPLRQTVCSSVVFFSSVLAGIKELTWGGNH